MRSVPKWFIVVLVVLQGCQSAKVTQLDVATNTNNNSILNNGGGNSQVLNAGVVNTGQPLNIEVLPGQTLIGPYRIFTQSEIAANLSLAFGTLYTPLLNIYNNYLSSLSLNPSTPVPSELQQMVTLSFLNGVDLPSVTASLEKFLNHQSVVLVTGQYAYLGNATLPPANVSDAAVSMTSVTDLQWFKSGSSTLGVLGGKIGTSVNRKISTITLSSNGTFSIVTSASMIPSSSQLKNVWAEPVDLVLSQAGSLATTLIGNSVLVAKASLASEIYGFNLVNLTSGQVSSVSLACSSVEGFFNMFSCPLIGTMPTGM